MTTAKQYLSQIRILSGRIRRNRARLAALTAAADGVHAIRYDGVKVQSTPQDQMARVIGELADLEQATALEIVRLEQLKTEATEKIHTIGYEDGEEILYLRWVECRSFYAIADIMHYSLRQVHRVHGKALRMLSERWHTMSQSDVL